jgi:hypothetical protein
MASSNTPLRPGRQPVMRDRAGLPKAHKRSKGADCLTLLRERRAFHRLDGANLSPEAGSLGGGNHREALLGQRAHDGRVTTQVRLGAHLRRARGGGSGARAGRSAGRARRTDEENRNARGVLVNLGHPLGPDCTAGHV